jgi:hypothetical protein
MSEPPFSCRCGKRWGGFDTAHCASCHLTFSTSKNFEKHRVDGKCLDPAQRGMTQTLRGGYELWVTPLPSTTTFRTDSDPAVAVA